jgi:hypothetical protein
VDATIQIEKRITRPQIRASYALKGSAERGQVNESIGKEARVYKDGASTLNVKEACCALLWSTSQQTRSEREVSGGGEIVVSVRTNTLRLGGGREAATDNLQVH